MAQSSAAPTRETVPRERQKPGYSFEEIEDGFIEVQSVLDGMHTNTPRGELPAGSAELIQNGRVRNNWMGTRGGLVEAVPKPDSDEVRGVTLHYPPGNRENWLIRVTDNSVHATQTGGSWTALTGDSPGDLPHRPSFVSFIDSLFMATRTNKVMELDLGAFTVSELSEAPKARFLATFGDRLIAARTLSEPTKIFWSARLDPTVWDPAEDITAGFESLVTGTTGPGDNITGIFGFERQLIILREGSIWHAERRGDARFPFAFQPVIGNQGCDMPQSAARVTTETQEGRSFRQFRGGIIFADFSTRGVWFYRPGIRPRRISTQVEDRIFDTLEDKEQVEAAFDPFNQEYHLKVSDQEVWVYSMRQDAWSLDDTSISTLGAFETVSDVIVIDDLTGVIDDLTGVIDDLGTDVVAVPGIAKGFSSGEVGIHDRSKIQDFGTDPFEFIFESPNFGSTARERTLKQMVASVIIEGIINTGSITAELSNDGENWRQALVRDFVADTTKQKITHRNKQITGDDLFWRVRTSEAALQLRHYLVKVLEKHHHQTNR